MKSSQSKEKSSLAPKTQRKRRSKKGGFLGFLSRLLHPRREVFFRNCRIWLTFATAFLIVITAAGGWFFWHARLDDSESGRNFRTVVIDPGHGGMDSGAIGFGVNEKDVALQIGLKVAELLRAQGIQVVLTRDSDRYISLGERARIANCQRDSIFVSIHFNHTHSLVAGGIETYRAETKSDGVASDLLSFLRVARLGADIDLRENALAQAVQSELIAATQTTDRGVKRENFFVIRRTHSPALLIEGGFLSNPTTVRKLKTTAYRDTLASAIASGILKYRSGWDPSPQLFAGGASR